MIKKINENIYLVNGRFLTSDYCKALEYEAFYSKWYIKVLNVIWNYL